ncbi:hypothetical protein BJX66DRAFT_347789 [Aspergillus keveii]|uniref:Tyrosinase copper-binding domain-containing protein n=1 Tax=Aspergillus keveii TaxID=714993 RepID=A0ABR4FP14_9EURO
MLLFSSFVPAIVAFLLIIARIDANPAIMRRLVNEYQSTTRRGLPNQGACTRHNLAVRKEWSTLDILTRKSYINAVKCLARLPSTIDPLLAPGARSRFDDFTATHIINTLTIHGTGSFFAWHRHFLYLFEKALREECGYTGYQPYWEWSHWANQPTSANPLYDGSSTSLSGNGRYIPNRNGTFQLLPALNPTPDAFAFFTPPGTGGGYIYSGPLKNWQLHLGPVVDQYDNGQPVPRNPRPDGLGYNPRGMIRDFNNTILQRRASWPVVLGLLVNVTDIAPFQILFFSGPHAGGHTFISGIDNDLFTSPGDPLFWFHHAQVDRIWSIWQSRDLGTREFAIDGTQTLFNIPPSPNATLDDLMPFDFSPPITVREAMSPTKGLYCYIYD